MLDNPHTVLYQRSGARPRHQQHAVPVTEVRGGHKADLIQIATLPLAQPFHAQPGIPNRIRECLANPSRTYAPESSLFAPLSIIRFAFGQGRPRVVKRVVTLGGWMARYPPLSHETCFTPSFAPAEFLLDISDILGHGDPHPVSDKLLLNIVSNLRGRLETVTIRRMAVTYQDHTEPMG